jgi:hypothetical protein
LFALILKLESDELDELNLWRISSNTTLQSLNYSSNGYAFGPEGVQCIAQLLQHNAILNGYQPLTHFDWS